MHANVFLQNFGYRPQIRNCKLFDRERDWRETPYRRVRLARARLLRHTLPISLLILREKPTVLQSIVLGELVFSPSPQNMMKYGLH